MKVDVNRAQPRKNRQLLLTILFAFVVAVSLILFLRNERDSTLTPISQTQVGLPAPDFSFPDLKGQEVGLSDHGGKVVLVNIWATWCHPCREEMPSMQRLYERFKGENFEILAVSIDSTGREAVAPFVHKLNLTFPALLDPEANIKLPYGVTGVPESFIVDKEGMLVKKIIGPIDWATPKVFRFFRDLIQEPKS